jgi:hypothetical protein
MLEIAASIPPVGLKRASGKGPANAFSAATPPALAAGKNLQISQPIGRRRSILPTWKCNANSNYSERRRRIL